ncbi:carbamate kinase [Myxococcota bacterium]|nr:carbamate kinase [Myxococcota bacterium]
MSKEKPIVVIALGGHAFMRHGEPATIEEHELCARNISNVLMTLIERDYNVIVTHGNGPQVGALLIQNELAAKEIPPQPLDVLVAMTEGSLGYILQQSLLNELRRRNVQRYVVTKITQVVVDENDPAFSRPTKPIGPFLSEEEAKRREKELGWNVFEDSGRGWRRRVASPIPLKVIQRHTIRDAAREGHIVVAVGGGGIPVIRKVDENGHARYEGVEAVIDKDLSSALLARQIGAELLIILTDVEKVYINFRKENQMGLGACTMDMIEEFHKQGQFGEGSMGPKIQAVLNFLKDGGKRALITSPDHLEEALRGASGTHFVGHI